MLRIGQFNLWHYPPLGEVSTKNLVQDFTGALSGATVGAKLPRPFAVICVLGGAFAGSVSAAFESKT